MKISVNADGCRFTIPFPTGIVLNGVTSHIIAGCVKKYSDVPLTAEQLRVLFNELKQVKKLFGKLILVDVLTNDGQNIKITL